MMSLNTGWIQQRDDQQINLGNTIVIKAENQTIGQAIMLKPEEQHLYLQTTDASGQQRGLIKLQPAMLTSTKNNIFTQTEPTNRFTQTDNTVSGTLLRGQDGATIMYEQAVQPQVYIATPIEGKKDGDPVCFNVNMLQKVPLHTTSGAAVGTAVMDDKGCYRLDMTQPFSYNYVVNPTTTTVLSAAPAAAAPVPRTYKCDEPECGLNFSHLSLLTHHKRLHMQQNQQNQQQHEEQQQQQQQQTVYSEVEVHCEVEEHELGDIIASYSCDICGESFNMPGEVKSHKNAMHKEFQLTMQSTPKVAVQKACDTCGAQFTVYQVQGLKKKKNFRCSACHTIRANSGDLKNEEGGKETMKGHHPVKKRGAPCVTKCMTCNGSGIIFIGGGKAKQAPTSDAKTFQCNICDGVFSRYSSLWSHKKLHDGNKPFKCSTCGLCFAKAAYLKNHYRVHTGEKPYRCDTCGLQFAQSPHLKNHERIHNGERPYQCEVCNKRFARHSTLWNHRRIHTGEKPYKCNVCNAKFNQATHLKNHTKVHTGEKPHKCDICGVSFADKFAMKRHRAVHEKYAKLSLPPPTAHLSDCDDDEDDDKKVVQVTFVQS